VRFALPRKDPVYGREGRGTLKEKLIKIGAKVLSHGRYLAFQMAEVAISRHLCADILQPIAELGPTPDVVIRSMSVNSRARTRGPDAPRRTGYHHTPGIRRGVCRTYMAYSGKAF